MKASEFISKSEVYWELLELRAEPPNLISGPISVFSSEPLSASDLPSTDNLQVQLIFKLQNILEHQLNYKGTICMLLDQSVIQILKFDIWHMPN